MKSRHDRKNSQLRKLWKNHIETWKKSGLNQAEYCRKNDLKKTRFTYWKLKFEKQYLPQAFVEVSQATIKKTFKTKAVDPLMIHCNSDFVIEVPQNFSSGSLKQILSILKEA